MPGSFFLQSRSRILAGLLRRYAVVLGFRSVTIELIFADQAHRLDTTRGLEPGANRFTGLTAYTV